MKLKLIQSAGGKIHIASGRMDTDLYGRRARVAACGKLIRDTGDDPANQSMSDQADQCNTCFMISYMNAKKKEVTK